LGVGVGVGNQFILHPHIQEESHLPENN